MREGVLKLLFKTGVENEKKGGAKHPLVTNPLEPFNLPCGELVNASFNLDGDLVFKVF